MEKPTFLIVTETIVRRGDGHLMWIGFPDDPRACAVQRLDMASTCGHAPADADLAMIDGLPVLDEAEFMASDLVIL